MSRIHNFSAGPGVLPEPVIQTLQQDIWEFGDSGVGLLECSHRSSHFEATINATRERLHRLLKLDDDQEVLFLHGGARTQFFMIPMNLLRGGRAAYLDTGIWAGQAAEEARRFGDVDVLFSSKSSNYDHVPENNSWSIPPDTLYLHYTSNNTVAGTEFHYTPEVPCLLVCDASSDFLAKDIDGSKFDIIYGGAQKPGSGRRYHRRDSKVITRAVRYKYPNNASLRHPSEQAEHVQHALHLRDSCCWTGV